MNVELGQIISQIIAFLIMLWLLKRFAWKPLMKHMEERKERIRAEFELIEKEKGSLNTLRTHYEAKMKVIDSTAKRHVQEELDKVRISTKEIEAEAHLRAKEIILKAADAAKIESAKAMENLKEEVIHLALSATETIIKTNLDNELKQRLIKERINKIS